MEQYKCSFCGNTMEIGTGKMFVKKDGLIMYFCKSKCEKNGLGLKRTPRKFKWTVKGSKAKQQTGKTVEKAGLEEKRKGTPKVETGQEKEEKKTIPKEPKKPLEVPKKAAKKPTKAKTKAKPKEKPDKKTTKKTSKEKPAKKEKK